MAARNNQWQGDMALWEALASDDESLLRQVVEEARDLNGPNPWGLVPLEYACQFASPSTVRLLLDAGALPCPSQPDRAFMSFLRGRGDGEELVERLWRVCALMGANKNEMFDRLLESALIGPIAKAKIGVALSPGQFIGDMQRQILRMAFEAPAASSQKRPSRL